MDVLLRAESLTKQYGSVTALDHVTFEIGATVTGLLGPNGAGKSTAIKIFLGLTRPTTGRAEVLGLEAGRDEQVRARLGYMPEHDCLPSTVSAAEFLTHMAEVSGLPPRQARTRAADTLRHVGLFEERYRGIGGYSTGMKQRVKLAQALVHDPRSSSLDEPTAGLDPPGREEMLALIRKTHREFGISVRHLVAPDGRRRAHVRPHHRAPGRPGRCRRARSAVHRSDRDGLHRGRPQRERAGCRARPSAA